MDMLVFMEGCWVHIYTSTFPTHHHHRNWKVYQQVGFSIATSIYFLAPSGALYATMRQNRSALDTFSLSPTQQQLTCLCTTQSISSNSIQPNATQCSSRNFNNATRFACRSILFSVSTTCTRERPQTSLFLKATQVYHLRGILRNNITSNLYFIWEARLSAAGH